MNYNAAEALTIPAVSRCIALVSGDAARLPVFSQQKTGDAWEVLEDTRLADLINRAPNPEISGNEWRSMVFRDLLTHGNHLSLIVRNGAGEVEQIQPQVFGTWSVNWKHDQRVLSYALAGIGSIAPADVLHIRLDGEQPFWGISPIDRHASILKTILAQYRAANSAFTSTLGKVALSTDDHLSPDAVRAISEAFEQKHSTAESWGSPIITGGGMQAKVFQNELSRNEYVSSQNFGVADVGRIFGVPASMLYASDQAGMTSSGTGQREVYGYIETGLRPLLDRFTSHLALKLLPPNQKLSFDTRALSRGSFGEAVASLRMGIDAGFLSPAEARKAMEMPPAPADQGLDQFVISKNYQAEAGDGDATGIDSSAGVED